MLALVGLIGALLGVATFTSPALAGRPSSPAPASRVALPDPVPDWQGDAYAEGGPAPTSLVLDLRLYFAGRAPQAEQALARAVSQPGGRDYGRYLTPQQFRRRFGAPTSQRMAVRRWATTHGLHVTGTTPHFLAVTGSAPVVDAALDTSIHLFEQKQGEHTVSAYAPVRGISVPISLGTDLSTVIGLDNTAEEPVSASAELSVTPSGRRRSMTERAAAEKRHRIACSAWWGEHVSRIPAAEGRMTAPDAVCGYTPQQLRSAYGVAPDDGRGSTIAIVLDGHLATMRADADRFFAEHHLGGFAPGQFTQDFASGFTKSCGNSTDVPEEPLDVEMAHTIAPAAKIVYVAANCGSNVSNEDQEVDWIDAQTRIVDDHLGDVETNSFSIDDSAYTEAMAAAFTQIFEQGAVEGIGFDFDAGDYAQHVGGRSSPTETSFPASDPWATSVGGAATEIGRTGAIVAQRGWGDTATLLDSAGSAWSPRPPGAYREGTDGGRSALFTEPWYQRGVVPPSLATDGGTAPADRAVPDIAADADPMTGYLIGYTAGHFAESLEGGTSGAAPLVAGLEADAQSITGRPVGFANPLLYALRAGPAIQDIVRPSAPSLVLAPNCYNAADTPGPTCLTTLGLDNGLAAASGFDAQTGIGAVTGRFITALAAAQRR